jgi:hypothetical protein
MYVRKKHNRSGSTSVVVVSKASGSYKELKSFGSSTSEEEGPEEAAYLPSTPGPDVVMEAKEAYGLCENAVKTAAREMADYPENALGATHGNRKI